MNARHMSTDTLGSVKNENRKYEIGDGVGPSGLKESRMRYQFEGSSVRDMENSSQPEISTEPLLLATC